jgi:hypothetical protein
MNRSCVVRVQQAARRLVDRLLPSRIVSNHVARELLHVAAQLPAERRPLRPPSIARLTLKNASSGLSPLQDRRPEIPASPARPPATARPAPVRLAPLVGGSRARAVRRAAATDEQPAELLRADLLRRRAHPRIPRPLHRRTAFVAAACRAPARDVRSAPTRSSATARGTAPRSCRSATAAAAGPPSGTACSASATTARARPPAAGASSAGRSSPPAPAPRSSRRHQPLLRALEPRDVGLGRARAPVRLAVRELRALVREHPARVAPRHGNAMVTQIRSSPGAPRRAPCDPFGSVVDMCPRLRARTATRDARACRAPPPSRASRRDARPRT